jgi:hypothetical protein
MKPNDPTSIPAWPEGPDHGVPNPEGAADYALQVRRGVLGGRRCLAPLRDLSPLYRAGRFRVRERRLSAATGGDEGLLLPAPDGQFDLWVDPTPRGGWESVPAHLRESLRRHRTRFRVAHEMAHSLFFERGHGTPRRRQRNSVRQEQFCDAFASALLVPPPAARRAPPSPDAVIGLQRRFDVSMELAARALADVHPSARVLVLYWATGAEIGAPTARVQWQSSATRGDRMMESLIAQAVRAPRTVSVAGQSARYLPRRRQLIVVEALR